MPDEHAERPSKKEPLKDILAEARDTARDQLTAAWQIEIERAREQLATGWRTHVERVFEERFAELSTQVEQCFAAELDTLLARAASKVRHDTANRLNHAVRRIRNFENEDDWSRAFVDATEGYCGRALLFAVNGKSLRLEAGRGISSQARIDNTPLESAAAFAGAVESRDTIVALRTRGELSGPIAELLGESAEQRAYLFPICTRDRVAAVLYGDTDVEPSALELLAAFATAVLEGQSAAPERTGLVNIAGNAQSPAPRPPLNSGDKENEELHRRAERFARVQVAEMRLYKAQAVKDGRQNRDLYGALRDDIDRVRDHFRRDFLSASPTMADYLHVELLRTLANNDVQLLGENYPGAMA